MGRERHSLVYLKNAQFQVKYCVFHYMKDIVNHACRVMKEAFSTWQTSEVCLYMTDDSNKVTNPPQKLKKKVKKQQGKTVKTKAEKQKQNELIREFTLMISKLLFQMSQINK